MRQIFKYLAAGCLWCALLATAGVRAEEKVSLNFVNADIEEVVKAVSHISKRNFIIDPRVKGSVNIVSSTPVPSSLAYDILLSSLRLQGFAAVESGGVTKIIPEADAKLHIGAADGNKGSGDKLVTRVYMLKHESAVQLVPVLRPLIAPNNVVVAYPNNNALVVTDYASNLKRIEQIIANIDKPISEAPLILPIKNASAVDLANTITRLMQDGAVAASGSTDASQRFALLADARTNSLLLRTDSPARIARVKELVAKLDVAGAATGNMHVVYLKNAEAAKVAATLRAVVAGDSSTQAAATPQAAAQPSGGGMIQADAASNALIITAPEGVYNNLRAVVEMLDVRRAQVYVEALVAEVTADKAAEFGVQWQGLGSRGDTQFGGGTNFTALGSGSNILGVANGINNNTPILSNGLNIGILKGKNLGALVHALESDANANILSMPNLMTLDNEEAKIIIGENVPFITGSYAQTGGTTTASPFQTIERKDVGLTLRIKPQISQGGTVKMQIYQEVSSVQSATVGNAAGPTTNKRSLETNVLVDDGQVIVLGGLISDTVSDSESKVPLLGDIPLLGSLFRFENRRRGKTNLMVFIRPYVMRTAEASNTLTQGRYDYLLGEQQESQIANRFFLPDFEAPELPPLELKSENALQTAPASGKAGKR